MKLFDGGMAPNLRRVRVFLAEKGLTAPDDPLSPDSFVPPPEPDGSETAEQPILVLDDDTVIADSLAICRYFEGLRPEPPLFGRPGREQAMVELWNRRIEVDLAKPIANAFRNQGAFVPRNDPALLAFLQLLDSELEERLFAVSDHYTVADISALVSIEFAMAGKVVMPDHLVHARRWYAQVSARPSANA